MQFISTKTPTPYRLIRILFYLLCTVVGVSLVLFFGLKIHETVDARVGEIIAENAPETYLAPFDAMVEKVYVKAGDFVEKDVILIQLSNTTLVASIEQEEQEYELAKQQVNHLQKLRKNLKSQSGTRQNGAQNLQQNYSYEKETASLELNALREQVTLQRKKMAVAKKRLKVDQNMLAEGLISEVTYLEKQQIFAKEEQLFTEIYKKYSQQKAQQNNLKNNHSNRLNAQTLDVLSVENQLLNLEKSITEAESKEKRLEQQINFKKKELEKLTVRAQQAGYISQIFNAHQSIQQINKGATLLTLTPALDAQFYAKFRIPQTAVKDVKSGQRAQIRLEAYNYYRYGVLEAEVIHVDKDTSDQFYALAKIPQQETEMELKNGFAASGKIITDKIRLSTYVYRELFK